MGAPKFTQVIQASLLKPDRMAELDRFRREITVLFADIRGSTAYFEKHGDIMGVMMVHRCTELLRAEIEKAPGGKFVKTIGDAVMATFEDPNVAVECAVGMQKALREHNATRTVDDNIAIRIGLNYGPGIVKSDDVFGDVVNVASRVESVSQADQIIIAASVHQRLSGVPFPINYLGKFALKGKEGPTDLFEVTWDLAKAARPVAAHTVLASADGLQLPTVRLTHAAPGTGARAWQIRSKPIVIGQSSGDIVFAEDARMAPQHARLSAESGQLMVEDLSELGVFVRLVATYMLQNKDVVLMGAQMMRFAERSDELAVAAGTGTALISLAAFLEAPPAQFLGIRSDGSETGAQYPLTQSEVTFGRSGTTYVFEKDDFMSRIHCKVYHRGENFFIEDCSRNGTYLKVQGKMPVPPGSSLIVGSQVFHVSQ